MTIESTPTETFQSKVNEKTSAAPGYVGSSNTLLGETAKQHARMSVEKSRR